MSKGSGFLELLGKLAGILPVAIETAEVGASLLAPGASNGVAKAAAVTQVIVAALHGYQTATGQAVTDDPAVAGHVHNLISGAVGLRNVLIGKGAAPPAPATAAPAMDVLGTGPAAAAAVSLPTSPVPAGAQS